MAYDNTNPTDLGHLKSAAQRSRNDVSELAGLVSGALEELEAKVVEGNVRIFYATCTTPAATQGKTITIEGLEELQQGDTFYIQMASGQTYDGPPTLTVNDLDPLSIRRISGTNAVKGEWVAGQVLHLVYNGSHFVIVDGGIASLSYYGKTRLSSDVDSDAENLAATPKAVKLAYDLAMDAQMRDPNLLGLYIDEDGAICQEIASDSQG